MRARLRLDELQGGTDGVSRGIGRAAPQVFFAGNNLSTRAWQELCELLEGKDFSINIISKSGTTTEPAIATRALRWMLERKYGAEKAKKRIYVTTDYRIRESISAFAGRLSADFFRTHRSYLVNLKAVVRIGRTSVLLRGGAEVPLARGKYDAINRAFIDRN